MSVVSEVPDADWDAWRTFTTMRRRLDRALERQLQTDAGLSAPDYEILLALNAAPDHQLRARDLASILEWEKSRISHQVTRMEQRGLVEKTECATDARGIWITQTTAGRKAMLAAMRDHTVALRSWFFDALSPAELATLATISNRVLGAIEPCATADDELEAQSTE